LRFAFVKPKKYIYNANSSIFGTTTGIVTLATTILLSLQLLEIE